MGSKNLRLAELASNINAEGLYTQTATVDVYQTVNSLPLSGNEVGDLAFIDSSNKLYIHSGEGWYNIGLVNQTPTITSGGDASYIFAIDGTPIVITLIASDPEGLPLTWSYAVTSGTLGNTATVSQADNVFTITPSTNTDNAGEFSITFTASDGINLATSVSSFTLVFGAADQYYNLNSLLLKTGSTAGLNNNTFVDESTNGFTLTPTGDVYQGSLSPYSPARWSAYLDGSGDYLRISDNEALQFGTGDFTIEAWVYPTSWTDTTLQTIVSKRESSSSYWRWGSVSSDGTLSFRHSGMTPAMEASGVLSLNQWQHVAVTRSSSTFYMYVNGQQVATTTAGGTTDISYTGSDVRIGAAEAAGIYNWPGYIADVRLIKGTALYTSNFTPPTEPLTAVSGTSLLTCQSPIFIDNSTNAHTITRNGDTKLVTVSPYLPSEKYDPTVHGGSAYFDGASDWLSISSDAELALGTGDFTWECWFYTALSSLPTNATLYDQRNGTNGSAIVQPVIELTSANGYAWYVRAANRIASGAGAVQLNVWQHLAVCRSSGTTKMFVDGQQVGNDFADTENYPAGSINIGRANDGVSTRYFTGYMANLRVVKGTALYTSNFVPPTQLLTAISGTALLLNMNNAGIYDNIGKNDIQIVGNTTTSTTQTKYNDTSLYFDGSGDRLELPGGSEFAFGTGDFTIEAWVYMTAASGIDMIYDSRTLGDNSSLMPVIYTDSNKFYFFAAGGNLISQTDTFSLNTWYHIAVSRSSGSTKMFINGVQTGSTYADTNDYLNGSGNRPFIGADARIGSGSEFTGYMEDVRITKGVARYTANFTPPTAPLGFNNAE